MRRDEREEAERGLRCYVADVAAAVGVSRHACLCEFGRRASAYLALSGRTPTFPAHDVALIWREASGWAAAVEVDAASTLVVLTYLGEDFLPEPYVVAEFVANVLNDDHPGCVNPPAPDHPGGLRRRLGVYGAIARFEQPR